jgi:hypothetical protein
MPSNHQEGTAMKTSQQGRTFLQQIAGLEPHAAPTDRRANERGISRRLVDFTLRHGRVDGNKHILDLSAARRLINELTEELKLARQILDKGGMTVVDGGDVLITAYNVNMAIRRRDGGLYRV